MQGLVKISGGAEVGSQLVHDNPGMWQLLQLASDSEQDHLDGWTDAAIRLLINTYIGLEHKFSDKRILEKQLWEGVAMRMASRSYNLSVLQCDEKRRSLKRTYNER